MRKLQKYVEQQEIRARESETSENDLKLSLFIENEGQPPTHTAWPAGYPGELVSHAGEPASSVDQALPQLPDLTIFEHSNEFRAPGNSKIDSERTVILRRKSRTLLDRNISVTKNLGLKSRQKPLSVPRFDYF